MNIALPNPFLSESVVEPSTDRPAAAHSPLSPQSAAATKFPRGFDVDRFMADIEEPPMFLNSPSVDYLAAVAERADA